MKAKKETTDRFPTWWLFYYVLRKAYFLLGIPFFLFCALGFTEMLCSDRYFGNKVEDYVVTFGSWFLLLAPGIWMYSRAKTRREKIRKVVQTIKESGFYSPEKGYEGLSLTQGAYFGIDLKNGTMFHSYCNRRQNTGNSYEIHQPANGSYSIMVYSSRNRIKHHARDGKSRI